jgi:integrase/recombinase XerC
MRRKQRVMTNSLIEAYVAWCRAAGFSPLTIRDRRITLERADRELAEQYGVGINSASVDEWQAWLGNPEWGEGSRCTYYGHIAGYLGWAVANERLDWSPLTQIRRPRAPEGQPRPVDDEHLATVLARAREPYRLIVLIAACSGLRCKEIAGLYRQDITEEWIFIRSQKGGAPGVIDTHPLLWEAVRDLPPGPLIRHPDGLSVTPYWVSRATNRHLRRVLKIAGVTMHRFRHWTGTKAYEETQDPFKVQQVLRHKSLTTTLRYTKVGNRGRRAAIHALPIPVAAAV